ncbi:MAG: hypothetical protein EXR98_15505 [Gemmataceae bacterium]|nr:hypothetical protein [Gemmataceae bacterium]
MVRAALAGPCLILLIVVGCTSNERYFEVAREQRAALHEITDILKTIKDEKSMADAKTALDEKAKQFEAIARKAKALPKPPPAEVSKRWQEDEFVIQAEIRQLAVVVKKVKELPGGEEFLSQFQSRAPGLFSRVQP